MKIVVIGSSGPLGSPLLATLRAAGHEAVAVPPAPSKSADRNRTISTDSCSAYSARATIREK